VALRLERKKEKDSETKEEEEKGTEEAR